MLAQVLLMTPRDVSQIPQVRCLSPKAGGRKARGSADERRHLKRLRCLRK